MGVFIRRGHIHIIVEVDYMNCAYMAICALLLFEERVNNTPLKEVSRRGEKHDYEWVYKNMPSKSGKYKCLLFFIPFSLERFKQN